MLNNSIYIRQVEFDDAPFILDWENNKDNWAVSENDSKYSLFDIVALISELQDVKKAKQGRWVICTVDTHLVVGCVDLTDVNFEEKMAGVGILIAEKENRRKGYALKALQLIEQKAKDLELNKLSCSIHSTNISSIDLFKKNEYKQVKNTSNDIYFFEKWLKK